MLEHRDNLSEAYSRGVSRFPEPAEPDDWQPATSKPGELYTFEGQLRSAGAFVRGARTGQALPRVDAAHGMDVRRHCTRGGRGRDRRLGDPVVTDL